METEVLSSVGADEILAGWSEAKHTVCFCICYGDNAWLTQRLGKVSKFPSPAPGMWVHIAGDTTELLVTARFGEITRVENHGALAIKFKSFKVARDAQIEIMLYISKSGQLDQKRALPLMSNWIN